MISVRRTRDLLTASFRFHLTVDTLAVQLYTSLLPRRIRDFHPLERAHGAQTTKKGLTPLFYFRHQLCDSLWHKPRILKKHHQNRGFVTQLISGLDESRTRVRRKIPCPSTSVVYSLTFPPRTGNKHPERFSSFMIRPLSQSFDSVVSHIVEAGFLRCECPRADCRH